MDEKSQSPLMKFVLNFHDKFRAQISAAAKSCQQRRRTKKTSSSSKILFNRFMTVPIKQQFYIKNYTNS